MELLELKANARNMTGKGYSRTLRREGLLPAVLYGPKTKSILLSINSKELLMALKKSIIGQALFELEIEGGEKRSTILKELQKHPVTNSFIHADFYEIDMNRKIKVMVPVTTTGKSVGVEMGGILQVIRRELEVLCLPAEIPEMIEIDVSELNIGDAIHINEIKVADNVELQFYTNFTVATIANPSKDEHDEGEEEGEGIVETEEGEDEAEEETEK